MTIQQEQTARQIIQKFIKDEIQFGMEAVATIMTNSGLHNPERIHQIIAEETAPKTVTEPTVTQAAVAVAEPNTQVANEAETIPEKTYGDGPLTEEEAVHIVKSWVVMDNGYELSERKSSEEMIESLRDAGKYRGSDVSV